MSENLVDAVTQSETQVEASTHQSGTEPVENEASWYWGEGVAGQGEAPDWYLGDKYKSVSEQAKGYKELLNRYNERLKGFVGSPEEGYALPEGMEEGGPLINMLTQIGAKYGMNQDMFNEIIENYNNVYGEFEQQTMQKKEERIKGEIEKLGANATQRLRNIADYAHANFSDEEAEELVSMATTAKAVEVMERLINGSKPGKMADPSRTAPVPEDAMKTMRDMQFATDANGNRLIDVDPNHRKKYRELVRSLNG